MWSSAWCHECHAAGGLCSLVPRLPPLVVTGTCLPRLAELFVNAWSEQTAHEWQKDHLWDQATIPSGAKAHCTSCCEMLF